MKKILDDSLQSDSEPKEDLECASGNEPNEPDKGKKKKKKINIIIISAAVLLTAACVTGAIYLQHRKKPAVSPSISENSSIEHTTQTTGNKESKAKYTATGAILSAALKTLGESIGEGPFSFTFMDIDFDGVCELIISYIGGSSGNDPAEIYKLTKENNYKNVGWVDDFENVRIYERESELVYLTESYNNIDASEYLWGKEYNLAHAQIGGGETVRFSLKGDRLETEKLFTKWYYNDGLEERGHLFYAFFIGGRNVSDKEYADSFYTFKKELTDKNMTSLTVKYSEWSALKNDEMKKDSIKNSYEAFSYEK